MKHLAGAFALVTDNRRCGYEHEYKQRYLQHVFRICIRIQREWNVDSRYLQHGFGVRCTAHSQLCSATLAFVGCRCACCCCCCCCSLYVPTLYGAAAHFFLLILVHFRENLIEKVTADTGVTFLDENVSLPHTLTSRHRTVPVPAAIWHSALPGVVVARQSVLVWHFIADFRAFTRKSTKICKKMHIMPFSHFRSLSLVSAKINENQRECQWHTP